MRIDLSANESPFLPSPRVLATIEKSLLQLNRYCDFYQKERLKQIIADYAGVEPGRILLGHGTDALVLPLLEKFSQNRSVVVTHPASSGCLDRVRLAGGSLFRLQLKPPLFDVNWKWLPDGPKIILIDFPNNPTGACLITRSQLKTLLEQPDVIVIVDEASYEYSGKTVIDLTASYPNLAVTRTFDKAFSLAGLRISWMAAGDNLLSCLEGQDQVSIGRIACEAAEESLNDLDWVREQVALTLHEREKLSLALEALGFQVYSSNGNYLLIHSPVPDLGKLLLEFEIMILDLSNEWLENFYRVSVGSPIENEALLKAIGNLLKTFN